VPSEHQASEQLDGESIMTNASTPAGWYVDPTGQGDARYWNGVAWTQAVARNGATVNMPIDPAQAQEPPAPGTQVQAPVSTGEAPEQSSRRSPIGAIFGIVAVLVIIVLIFVIVSDNDSSDDSPTPGTGVAPSAPATNPPVDTG
jgi:hypothetical protein